MKSSLLGYYVFIVCALTVFPVCLQRWPEQQALPVQPPRQRARGWRRAQERPAAPLWGHPTGGTTSLNARQTHGCGAVWRNVPPSTVCLVVSL